MSLQSWKDEFYFEAAASTSVDTAVANSLRKWKGLSAESITKHELELLGLVLKEKNSSKSLHVGRHACALCYHYYGAVSSADPCKTCPLFLHTGHTCDEKTGPFSEFLEKEDNQPMVLALQQLFVKQCLPEKAS